MNEGSANPHGSSQEPAPEERLGRSVDRTIAATEFSGVLLAVPLLLIGSLASGFYLGFDRGLFPEIAPVLLALGLATLVIDRFGSEPAGAAERPAGEASGPRRRPGSPR